MSARSSSEQAFTLVQTLYSSAILARIIVPSSCSFEIVKRQAAIMAMRARRRFI
jgi:hypothetical protein